MVKARPVAGRVGSVAGVRTRSPGNVNRQIGKSAPGQASEEVVGASECNLTPINNGYGEFAAGIYKGAQSGRLWERGEGRAMSLATLDFNALDDFLDCAAQRLADARGFGFVLNVYMWTARWAARLCSANKMSGKQSDSI